MRTTLCCLILLASAAFADEPAAPIPNRPHVPGTLLLHARSRDRDSGLPLVKNVEWPVAETVIIVCDMWDDLYCRSAAHRIDLMAPRMNEVLTAARSHGVMVVHAPSNCMHIYAATPQRLRMQQAPHVDAPFQLDWCDILPDREPPIPLKLDVCRCDDPVVAPVVGTYTQQHPRLDILGYDGISDSGQEIYNFCQALQIRNIVLMGVHSNACVLGRSFGIRQQVRLGRNVVLCRDLTDCGYDPREPPYISHARGAEIVVEHIERYWCPSILADDLTHVIAGSNHARR